MKRFNIAFAMASRILGRFTVCPSLFLPLKKKNFLSQHLKFVSSVHYPFNNFQFIHRTSCQSIVVFIYDGISNRLHISFSWVWQLRDDFSVNRTEVHLLNEKCTKNKSRLNEKCTTLSHKSCIINLVKKDCTGGKERW